MCLEDLKHQNKLNYTNKDTRDGVSGYKTMSKVWLLYLEIWLQQASHG